MDAKEEEEEGGAEDKAVDEEEAGAVEEVDVVPGGDCDGGELLPALLFEAGKGCDNVVECALETLGGYVEFEKAGLERICFCKRSFEDDCIINVF